MLWSRKTKKENGINQRAQTDLTKSTQKKPNLSSWLHTTGGNGENVCLRVCFSSSFFMCVKSVFKEKKTVGYQR